MLRFVLDTDYLTLFEHGHRPVKQHLATQAPAAVGLTAVTVRESLRGRLAAIAKAADGNARIARYGLLLGSLARFQLFPLVPFDQAAEDHFQRLVAMRCAIGEISDAYRGWCWRIGRGELFRFVRAEAKGGADNALLTQVSAG